MLLTSIFSILLLGIFFMALFDKSNNTIQKLLALSTSSVSLLLSTVILARFDTNNPYFQEVANFTFDTNLLNLSYSFGLDGISVLFFFLKCFISFSLYFIYLE